MIQTYIETKFRLMAELQQKLQQMRKEIEDFHTVHELVGKRVRVSYIDIRHGKKKSFYAYYMGVKINEIWKDDIYLEIIFYKQFNMDNSVMLHERNYRITRWSPNISMKLAPAKHKPKEL